MAITDWPADERPREKLLQRGPAALSDAELLAIFLRTGIVGKTAVDLARELPPPPPGPRRAPLAAWSVWVGWTQRVSPGEGTGGMKTARATNV